MAPHAVLQSAADEVHFARTEDGWRLALHRHRHAPGAHATPVILCAGYGCNRHFVDFDERYSLARHLARSGFDAWVLELRGRGLSHASPSCVQPHSWTFDDLVLFDVPAAVTHVAGHTSRDVTWVGHSMGGMALYAFLGGDPPAAGRVRAGVAIASPVVFPHTVLQRAGWLGHQILRLPSPVTIHQRVILSMLWTVLGNSAALSVGMNPENVDRRVVGQALRRSITDVPRAKLDQLARWSLEGSFCSLDHRVDYRAALREITTPLLVVNGSIDRLATPEGAELALEHLAAAPTTYLEFGRRHGHAADYGHVDLIFGRYAPDEVFPAVADWLVRTAAPGAARAAGAG